MTVQAAPGVVLAVWTSSSEGSTLIRLGDVLQGKPAVANHVAVITHQDAHSRWIGIEGRPGGVGPVDVTHWLDDSRTRGNYAQIEQLQQGEDFADQLTVFLASCAKSMGIQYDWIGIAQDTCEALQLHDMSELLDHLWRWPSDHDVLPGHLVCSSAAAAIYGTVDWEHPKIGAERKVTPGDWWNWSDKALWHP